MSPRSRRPQGGFSLVELMVSLVLVGIITGLTFSIFANISTAMTNQRHVAELQQTLRAAEDVIGQDLRQAGYLAAEVRQFPSPSTMTMRSLKVDDAYSDDGADSLTLLYNDLSTRATIMSTGPSYNSAETLVDTTVGFTDGDLVMAVYIGPDPAYHGHGCLLMLTNVQASSSHLQHHRVDPWNGNQNEQCDGIAPVWDSGMTVFSKFTAHGYRIKPNDPQGILQLSPTGGLVADDWVDLAFGIVDLQVALRVYKGDDDPEVDVDHDGDGDPRRDWYSGANMETVLDYTGGQILMAKVTIVGRTIAEASRYYTTESPDLTKSGLESYNDVGNHASIALPAADPSSRYAGRHLYRTQSFLIDLRNMGVGQ